MPKIVFVPEWNQIERVMHNAVVQVIAHVGQFNWREPYKVEEQTENRGSGFIIDTDGHIVTNAHVVSQAKRIWIHMPLFGQQAIHAEIVGFCPIKDLALLQIVSKELHRIKEILKGLPFLMLGDSDSVRRTDNVLVLGYPLGHYGVKSTTGIVSGREPSAGQSLIQITAPLNPGSSGGPLLNEQGHVVGIMAASIAQASNVGYAIAINEFKQIVNRLTKEGLVKIPLLGVQFIYSNDDKAEFLGNPLPSGLYISQVLKNSLCEKAGICVGDMLYEFNGFLLDGFGDSFVPWSSDKVALTDLIARVNVGDTIKMVIYRNGKRHEISFVYNHMPEYPIRTMYSEYETIDYETLAGLVIMQLADNHFPELLDDALDLIYYTKFEHRYQARLVVSHILSGSLAYQMRSLMPGDIIRYVNDVQVNTLDEYRKALPKSLESGFVTIKTEHNIVAVFKLDAVLHDEEQLSKDFAYPFSAMCKQLIEKIRKV